MGSTVFFQSASELATLSNTFLVNNVATNPTTTTLVVTSPSGVVSTYTAGFTNAPVGVFSIDVACNEAGEWQYLWTGTGAVADAQAGSWTVYEIDLGKLYCTPQALKSRLGITDTQDDYEIHAACFAASRHLENFCERVFYRSTDTRTFVPDNLYMVSLGEFNDLVSVTSLAVDFEGDGVYETTWATTDYQLLPTNSHSAAEQRPYTAIRAVGTQVFPYPNSAYYTYSYSVPARFNRVQVQGVWGWPAVPWGVRMAALILAEETLKLKEAPFGVAGFGEFGAVQVRQNPKVKVFAGPYAYNPENLKGMKGFYH